MKQRFAIRDVDYLAVGVLIGLSVLFVTPTMGWPNFLMIFIVIVLGASLWGALRTGRAFPINYRITTIFLLAMAIHFLKLLPQERMSLTALYFALFFAFSTRQTRMSASLRSVVGILSVIALSGSVPPWLGLPFALLLSFLFIGALISTWSGMALGSALVWFAKRSVRRETVFLIIFLSGIAAVGLRQAQDYAGRQSALSGLSRLLSPGSMNNLMMSPALAMRVKFSKPMDLPPSETYLRGTVMDRFIGFNWAAGMSRLMPRMKPEPGDLSYQVAISPRYNDFVPVLDYGVAVMSDGPLPAVYSLRNNGVFQAFKTFDSWNYYTAYSRGVPLHELSVEDQPQLLQVPEKIDPAIIDLARKMRNKGGVGEFMHAFGEYIKNEGFEYSLNPGNISISLEGFLFRGKRGSCEHYAAAGASLARLSGIPARVVAGFLGGAWDQSLMTLFIRDLDAHAWVELWDSKASRWVRFDPVAFVAPDRVFLGAESFLRSIGANIPDEGSMRDKLLYATIFMELDNFLATLNGGFVSSFAGGIINYGEELALIGAFGLLISFIILRIRRFLSERQSPEARYVGELEKLLERLGVEKNCGEPLDTWIHRVVNQHDDLANELATFSSAYMRYCYGKVRTKNDLEIMNQATRAVSRKLRISYKLPIQSMKFW